MSPYRRTIVFLSCALLAAFISVTSCSTQPDFIIRISDDGFLLVYVPLCEELDATMEFPYAFHKTGYQEQIICKSGDSYSISVHRIKSTGVNSESEYEVVINGQKFHIRASDPKPEIAGNMVAFLLSEDSPPLPYTALPRKGDVEENIAFSYNVEGRRQVSSYELESEGRRFMIKYDDYRYDDIGILKGFSIHLSTASGKEENELSEKQAEEKLSESLVLGFGRCDPVVFTHIITPLAVKISDIAYVPYGPIQSYRGRIVFSDKEQVSFKVEVNLMNFNRSGLCDDKTYKVEMNGEKILSPSAGEFKRMEKRNLIGFSPARVVFGSVVDVTQQEYRPEGAVLCIPGMNMPGGLEGDFQTEYAYQGSGGFYTRELDAQRFTLNAVQYQIVYGDYEYDRGNISGYAALLMELTQE